MKNGQMSIGAATKIFFEYQPQKCCFITDEIQYLRSILSLSEINI